MALPFSQLFELLKDSSVDIQITAHTLLQRMIKAQTSDLVVKVELETETPITVSLPKELIEILSSGLEGTKSLPAEAAHMQIVSPRRLLLSRARVEEEKNQTEPTCFLTRSLPFFFDSRPTSLPGSWCSTSSRMPPFG